jgi:hypothetical protein
MRRTLGLVVVLAMALAFLLGFQAMPTATEDKACDVAARWVRENPQDVPFSLDRVAALPPVYKRIVFNSFTPERKSALWREHLRRFLANEKLSDEQKAFVQMAIKLATPELYRDAAKGRTPVAQAQHSAHHKAIREQARGLFSPQMRRVFADLGYSTTAAAPLPATLRVASLRPNNAAFEVACECEIGDNWCSWEDCARPPAGCEETPTGCGFPNCGPCNGTCGGDLDR